MVIKRRDFSLALIKHTLFVLPSPTLFVPYLAANTDYY